MENLFYKCTSLISVDLSNFQISGSCFKGIMNYMFYGCENLKYIDFSNFQGNKLIIMVSLNENNNDNLEECLNEGNSFYNILSQKICSFLECGENVLENKKNIIFNNIYKISCGNNKYNKLQNLCYDFNTQDDNLFMCKECNYLS